LSRTISSTYTKRTLVNYRTRSPIRAVDWRTLAQHQNLLWTRLVAEWGGHVFDPPFVADSSTSSPINQSSGRDLNELSIAGIATRPNDNGKVLIALDIYGNDVRVSCDVVNTDSGNVVGSLGATAGGGEWDRDTDSMDLADAQTSGGNPALLDVQNLQAEGVGADDLYQIRIGEAVVTSASGIPSS